MLQPPLFGKRAQGLHRLVRILRGQAVVSQQILQGFIIKLVVFRAFERVCLLHVHTGLGDRAGLVDAQNVHARERLNALHIMQQHLPAGKAHGPQHERNRRQHVKPLGDHADDGGNRGDDAFLQRLAGIEIALGKQNHADRHDRKADPFDDPVDRADHFRLLPGLDSLGLARELRDIRFIPDLVEPRVAPSRHNEAAGQEFASGFFFNFVALAREKRLVDLHRTLQDRRVRRDLIPRRQNNNIAPHQIVCRKLLLCPVSERNGMRRVEQAHLIQNALGAQLLKNADERISDNDRQKRQVAVRAHEAQKHRDDDKNQVKKRKRVRADDLPGRLSAGVALLIGKALRAQSLCLLGAQAAKGRGVLRLR